MDFADFLDMALERVERQKLMEVVVTGLLHRNGGTFSITREEYEGIMNSGDMILHFQKHGDIATAQLRERREDDVLVD